jgi:diguanylate cyclase (GGDEF)-like protein
MLYVGIATFCLLALLIVIFQRALLQNYVMMERDNSHEGMNRVLLAFFDEYRSLAATAYDYASWDDTYDFVSNLQISERGRYYLGTNYTPSFFVSNRINYALLFDNSNQVVFTKSFDYTSEIQLEHPRSFVETLMSKYPDIFEHSDPSAPRIGLIMSDKQPVILASYPVLTSNDDGPVGGTLIFARFLDSHDIEHLSAKLNRPLMIQPAGPSALPPNETTRISGPEGRSIPFWTKSDSNIIQSFAVISDIHDQPSVILEYSAPRELYINAKQSFFIYLSYFAASGVLFLLIVYIVLGRTLFSRMNQVKHRMKEIETLQDFSIRIPESGNDELTQFQKSFNHMMSSLEQAQHEIQFQAEHDGLTGLANRNAGFHYLERMIAKSVPSGDRFAVLFIDLDHFKMVNDTMGHHIGDLLLIQLAGRLKECAGEGDFVCRLGGDEFAVITAEYGDPEQIVRLVELIRDKIEETFQVEGRNLTISSSIGISMFPEHGTDAERLLMNSDTAMLDVKDTGKKNFRWYTEEMETNRTRRWRIERSLHKAIAANELQLYFQPKWDLAGNKTAGAEALLRWTNPRLGEVSPYEFIPIAESSGSIHEIGEWVIRAVCRQVTDWRSRTPDLSLVIAINISGVQLLTPGFVERISSIFAEEQVDPHHFELEVTESFAIEKFDEVIDVLVNLRRMGFTISIDDFGAGYTSMKYICQLPIQCMKIDKTLIDSLSNNVRNRIVVSTLIEMAHRLKLTVVAEGVETLEQMHFLQSQQCDQIQGYWIGRPMPGDKLMEFLEDGKSEIPDR